MGDCVQRGGSLLFSIQLTGDWVRIARKGHLKAVELKMTTGTQLQV